MISGWWQGAEVGVDGLLGACGGGDVPEGNDVGTGIVAGCVVVDCVGCGGSDGL